MLWGILPQPPCGLAAAIFSSLVPKLGEKLVEVSTTADAAPPSADASTRRAGVRHHKGSACGGTFDEVKVQEAEQAQPENNQLVGWLFNDRKAIMLEVPMKMGA